MSSMPIAAFQLQAPKPVEPLEHAPLLARRQAERHLLPDPAARSSHSRRIAPNGSDALIRDAGAPCGKGSGEGGFEGTERATTSSSEPRPRPPAERSAG